MFPEALSWRRRQSWVVIVNLAREPLAVTASLLRDSGGEIVRTLSVGPRARTGQEIGAWFGLTGGDSSNSLEVACSVSCAVSVIAWEVSGGTLINPVPSSAVELCRSQ